MGSIGKGGELELELVNGGPVLELGLAIAQRASGEGEEGRQWQGAREGWQGPGSGLGKADGRSSVRLCSRKKKGVNVRARGFGNRRAGWCVETSESERVIEINILFLYSASKKISLHRESTPKFIR